MTPSDLTQSENDLAFAAQRKLVLEARRYGVAATNSFRLKHNLRLLKKYPNIERERTLKACLGRVELEFMEAEGRLEDAQEEYWKTRENMGGTNDAS